MNAQPLTLASIEAFCFRVPVQTPIKLAFGIFRDRPFVLVHVVDTDGAEGWGEAWCNWPAVGAEHRARLVVDLGERLLVESVPVYPTDINPDEPEHFAAARHAEGHRAFCDAIEDLKLSWFEEPIRVDASESDWLALTAASKTPLAGGENFHGEQFTRALASLHVLAAVGGEGLLEFDCHPNVGREAIVGSLLPVHQGRVPVPQTPGLGAVPDIGALERFKTWSGKTA